MPCFTTRPEAIRTRQMNTNETIDKMFNNTLSIFESWRVRPETSRNLYESS